MNNICNVFVVEELKNFIHENAKKNCLFDGTTIGNNLIPVKYVPLLMDEYQEKRDSDETGHLHTRKEIINKSKNTISGILPKDFFERSRQHILDTSDYNNALTDEAKEKVLKKKGNVVGIIGQAGVGKSTLMKNLFYCTVTDEQLYNADFVFYIKLRDFFDKTEMNLFQFLMGNAAYDSLKWMKDSVIYEEVFKLLSQSESVCILLDGFDEAGIDDTHLKENPNIKFDVYGQNSSEHYILGLLNGEILPSAKKLITSRPGQMLVLPASYKPTFIVKIFGIEQQDIKQICFNICGDEYASQVFTHIETQPDLLSYCLVPINCILTIYCIYRFLKEKIKKSLPKNITGVFVLTFFCFSKTEHMREHLKEFDIKKFSNLKKISKLAWNGIKNKKIYFDKNDLKEVGLNSTNISSFTVAHKQKNQESWVKIVENATKKCIYFSHLLLQEFFAAVFCLYFMKFTKFKAIFSDSSQFKLTNNRLEMISKFMFGLSNPETFETLKGIYPNISKPTQHIKRLKDLAIDTISSTIKEPSFHNVSTYSSVCCWGYETQDLKFCEILAESLPNKIELNIDEPFLLSSDILSFCYVIKERKTNLRISFGPRRSPPHLRSIIMEFTQSQKKLLHLWCKEMESILADSSNIQVNFLILLFACKFFYSTVQCTILFSS